MKALLTIVICFLSLSLAAQNVSITFQGGTSKNKNYQVVVDGISYYSANSVSTSGRKVTTIANLSPGAHTLDVYDLKSNVVANDGSGNVPTATKPVYSKRFQLRQGYDMNISIRGNGLVSFTEKRSQTQLTAQAGTPMTSTAFNQLVQNIQAQRYQSSRITAVRNAINVSGNYFTTTQVQQLLTLINAENRRLELAKLSYSKVTDKANFRSVYEVLSSEMNRDALDDYVVQQGGYLEVTQSNTAYATVMPDADFSVLLNRTRNYSYEADRLTEIRNALNSNNYYNTSQIKQLLSLVKSETERLAFAKTAYNRVLDKSTFNQLVDLFYVQSNRDNLNNFIVSNGGVANTSTYRVAMSDASFTQIYNKAGGHFLPWNIIKDIRTAFGTTSNYFSTDQVKQLLQLVSSETSKLELAKLAYARVVDAMNFPQLLELFTTQSSKTDLENFIRLQQ